MIKLIGVVIIMVLLIVLIINTKETYINYSNVLKNFEEESNNNLCAPLENLKKEKEKNNFKSLACSSANFLVGVSDKCRKDYCEEMSRCNYKNNNCISKCELISTDFNSSLLIDKFYSGYYLKSNNNCIQ